MARSSELSSPFEGLHATPTARLPYQADVVLRSYLLERPEGNVIVYNSPGVTAAASAIRAFGPVERLLINHEHEAMYGAPDLDAPVFVHERDRAATARSMSVAGVFTERERLGDDLEVIPTPGHTPGTTSFLWNNGRLRFLFTGDFMWIENGEWHAVVLDPSSQPAYLQSLALVRELEFDVLVPWGVTEGDAGFAHVDRTESRSRVDAIIRRVKAGENR
ncbi:MBL fold metallo-hydrolase [Herbiconiux daphne]|uniref:MBL fold metallo-hydrolase n=1 Tax=Herbiconiux daphne TaxID=2970914 RepID=A0ABT2GZX1_9MICO|nr:MBL fold metallo-hydrolase [Herbiconiux daphne]MCS5733456.1 MBL fold metallo-hydrolase [Herbiconiux daphne]